MKNHMDIINKILQDWQDMKYQEVASYMDKTKFLSELKFLQDCENLNFVEIAKYIEDGNDVNAVIDDNYALKIVTSSPLSIVLIELLKRSPDLNINIRDDRGKTPLMLSCISGKGSLTKKLMQIPGVDINCQSNNGYTAAMLAVYHGNDECVKVMAENDDVDWNRQNQSGQTAVMLAIAHNRSDYLRLMKNVQWNIRSKNGLSAFTLALKKLKGSSKETKEKWTSSAIHLVHNLLDEPELEIDIEHLESAGVYDDALLQCKRFVYNKMVRNYRDYVASIHDVSRLFVYATVKDMTKIANVLAPSPSKAAKACRDYVGKMMDKDETLLAEDNVTELLYALRKNLDKIASVLISGITVPDILLLSKIFQVEQEKKRKYIETDEKVEDSVPCKRIKGI